MRFLVFSNFGNLYVLNYLLKLIFWKKYRKNDEYVQNQYVFFISDYLLSSIEHQKYYGMKTRIHLLPRH